MWGLMDFIGFGGIVDRSALMQNAVFGPLGDGGMLDRLNAAKVALRNPDRVERLPSGRGWRIKPTNVQLELNRMMAQYTQLPRTPVGHDHRDWL